METTILEWGKSSEYKGLAMKWWSEYNAVHHERLRTIYNSYMDKNSLKKRREKYARYYLAHRDVLREKAHKRYFSRVHILDEPPPLRSNLRVALP